MKVSAGPRTVAVVVTWNRRDLLSESLTALRGQTVAPSSVIVVDNASTDGTSQLLTSRFPEVEVVRAVRNTGGAGGFALGLSSALRQKCDAVWLMDDDTVPRPTALEALLSAREGYRSERPVLTASRVLWTNGREHPMNTPRPKFGARIEERRAAAEVGCRPIRSASFVSILVDVPTVRARGLPLADYFLWNDDFEFTTRLIRGRRGLYCPASVVVHKTTTFGSIDVDPGERFFYEVRNKVWLFGRSSGLNPLEKALYAGSTLRRWTRTFVTSADRRTLWRAFLRGARDGVKTVPRPTAEILAVATGSSGVGFDD